MRSRTMALVASAALAACAHKPPPAAPPKDEFVGFGALRGEAKDKKAEKGDDAGAAKADAKPDPAAEQEAEKWKELVVNALGTAQERVDGCYKKFHDPGIYVVEITIAQNGQASVEPIRAPTRKEEPDLWKDIQAGVDGGKNPKSPSNRCLASAIGKVKFPPFVADKPRVVTYPIVLRKP
jgi:hypothetical protein